MQPYEWWNLTCDTLEAVKLVVAFMVALCSIRSHGFYAFSSWHGALSITFGAFGVWHFSDLDLAVAANSVASVGRQIGIYLLTLSLPLSTYVALE